MSLTPGFSQVKRTQARTWKPFRRFPLSSDIPITRLKPGVKEKLDLDFCAALSALIREHSQVANTFSSARAAGIWRCPKSGGASLFPPSAPAIGPGHDL